MFHNRTAVDLKDKWRTMNNGKKKRTVTNEETYFSKING